MKALYQLVIFWISIACVINAQTMSVLENGLDKKIDHMSSRPVAHIQLTNRISQIQTKDSQDNLVSNKAGARPILTHKFSTPRSSILSVHGHKSSTFLGKLQKPSKYPGQTKVLPIPSALNSKVLVLPGKSNTPIPASIHFKSSSSLRSKHSAATGNTVTQKAGPPTPPRPSFLIARTGVNQDAAADISGIAVPLSSSASKTVSGNLRFSPAISGRSTYVNQPVTVARNLPSSSIFSPERTMIISRGSAFHVPLGPTASAIRSSTSLPFANRELSTRTRVLALSTQSGASNVLSTVVPPPMPHPTTTSNPAVPAGCQCNPKATLGMYCGYCSAIISCDKNMGCRNNAYGCSSRGCINYGMLDSCYRAAMVMDQNGCPFFW